MTLLWIAEALAVGGVTGFLSGLLGVGGGFILIPLLTLMGIPIHMAVGTSMAFIICASLAGIVQHVRQGSIDLPVAGMISVPAAAMAHVGAHLSGNVPPWILHLSFGTLLGAILGLFRLWPLKPLARMAMETPGKPALPYVLPRHRLVADVPYTYHVNVILAVLSGLGTGVITGFFGVGGGFVLVPALVLLLHIPLPVTIGTSLAVIISPALIGTIAHWQLGHVNVGLWFLLAASGIAAGQVGARCTVRFRPEWLKALFQWLLLAAALFMLGKGLLA
ncbi:MAG TPA: sulfite exporter TauE/SafE family protein [Candidatus Tectomicrobia bacterium]